MHEFAANPENYIDPSTQQTFFANRQSACQLLISKPVFSAILNLPVTQQNKIKKYLLSLNSDKLEKLTFIPSKVRPRSKLFRALGSENPPLEVQINEISYRQVEVFKHDSWAATALYENQVKLVVCKFNRQQSIFGLPMQWLGVRLAARENKILKLLADSAHIPRYSGEVMVNGQVQSHVSAHDYVQGTPLRRYQQRVGDHFFPTLQTLLKKIHDLKISYMDLNKQENILVREDGEPCLIDFQICFHLPKYWPGNSVVMRYLLKLLQESDRYHLMKHTIRFRPDLLTPQELEQAKRRPWFLNVYRCLQIPLRTLRRQLLVALGFRGKSGQVTSEIFVEDGMRKAQEKTHVNIIKVKIAECLLILKYDSINKILLVDG